MRWVTRSMTATPRAPPRPAARRWGRSCRRTHCCSCGTAAPRPHAGWHSAKRPAATCGSYCNAVVIASYLERSRVQRYKLISKYVSHYSLFFYWQNNAHTRSVPVCALFYSPYYLMLEIIVGQEVGPLQSTIFSADSLSVWMSCSSSTITCLSPVS